MELLNILFVSVIVREHLVQNLVGKGMSCFFKVVDTFEDLGHGPV